MEVQRLGMRGLEARCSCRELGMSGMTQGLRVERHKDTKGSGLKGVGFAITKSQSQKTVSGDAPDTPKPYRGYIGLYKGYMSDI